MRSLEGVNLYGGVVPGRLDVVYNRHDIHVLHCGADIPPPEMSRLRGILVEEERTRADRFYFDRDRDIFTVTRATLRILLTAYLGGDLDPCGIVFDHGPNGKPHVAVPASKGINFNVSHSGRHALLAFSAAHEVGVDIQQLRGTTDLSGIAERFFAASEVSRWHRLPPGSRARAFYACWARKEAFIKATGRGLSYPLKDFTVPVEPTVMLDEIPVVERAAGERRYRIRDLEVSEGYVGTLCWHVDSNRSASAQGAEETDVDPPESDV